MKSGREIIQVKMFKVFSKDSNEFSKEVSFDVFWETETVADF